MALVRKALSFRRKGRYNVQEAKENRFPTRSDSSYKRMELDWESDLQPGSSAAGGGMSNSESRPTTTASKSGVVEKQPRSVRLRRGDSDSKVAEVLRDTFCTIRQKIRSSVRQRRKRLNNDLNTPASTLRRSLRIRNRAPREIDAVESPGVRLNRFKPKRCNFSSPGQLTRDIESVSQGIQSLSDMGNQMDQKIAAQNC